MLRNKPILLENKIQLINKCTDISLHYEAGRSHKIKQVYRCHPQGICEPHVHQLLDENTSEHRAERQRADNRTVQRAPHFKGQTPRTDVCEGHWLQNDRKKLQRS